MLNQIEKLYQISRKEERVILGLMSGTSLDGLDIALCRIKSHGVATEASVEKFTTAQYDANFRSAIRRVFAQRDVDLQDVTLLNGWVGEFHADLILSALKEWGISPEQIDCIASHGQTIFHCPIEQHGLPDFGHGTLQIGDGDRMAAKTGIITLSDFRQKQIAAGGEGAPLAVYGDYMVFSEPDENRVLLNLGGIANFTWLPAKGDATEVFSTDVGPGNTIIDAFVSRHFSHLRYDSNGDIAAQGNINQALLHDMLAHPFFTISMPKTTGPEVFNLDFVQQARLRSETLNLSVNDVVATLTAFSAAVICRSIKEVAGDIPIAVYASGGGVHNPVLMSHIRDGLGATGSLHNLESLGINPDAKEALLFAILANENLAGSKSFENNRYGIPSTTMGKISLP